MQQDELDPLNRRELEILHLISKGLSNNEIALRLNLSLETIKWHNKHIYSKLGVGSRSQAVAKAGETGVFAGQAPAPVKKEFRPVHNLPAPITSFIGREKEIQEIRQLTSNAQLVTITGSGGVGKTRLAIQAATTLAPQFKDGVCWTGLATLSNTGAAYKPEIPQTRNEPILLSVQWMGRDLIAQAVANALRIPDTPELPILQRVIDHLHEREMLLVLDNCEHLIEACAAFVEQILSPCPRIRILATSREALSVPGEKAWRLPSLTLPPAAGLFGQEIPADFQTIYQTEAVRLFIERAGDVLPGYQPEEADLPTLAQVCQRLDGIPLAIELAAARMKLLSLQEIESRLDRRFSLLTGGHRTALPRHQTLQAAIEWSYDLLSPAEQVLFCRLSIFAGSFTMEAAEAICASQELPAEEVLTLLGRLVEKSLLNVEPAPRDSDLATRYRFLDTIHSFGRLKLGEANETRWMRDRHADYYVDLVEAVGPELLLKNQVRWYKLLQAESDNLRAVVDWSVESNQAEQGLRVLSALLWFLWSHGSSLEGLDMALRTLALPSARPPTKYRARALNTAGYLHWVHGDTEAARANIEEAVSILKESDDQANLAWSLQLVAMVLTSQGEYDRADQAMKEGVAVSQKLDDYQSSVFSITFNGDIALRQGDRQKAMKIYGESVDKLRAYGNLIFLAYPLRRLGYLHLERNETEQAGNCFRQSLELNREVGDKRAVLACLTGIAALALRLNEPVQAAKLSGAVESQLDLLSMNLLPMDQIELNRIHHKLGANLDPTTRSTAYSEGRDLSEAEAIALAASVNY